MSEKRTFFLVHDTARLGAQRAIREAPDGYQCVIQPPNKKRAQEERYHAMVGDIAAQCEFMGQRWHREDWKRLLVDLFAETMRISGTPLHHDGRVCPSLDGKRVVQLGIQTRDFYVKEASEFIEFLFAFGAERSVRWTDRTAAAEPA